jgi:hypothetical protein
VMFSGLVPVLISALIIACSRAPEPKTKIFITPSLPNDLLRVVPDFEL